MKGQTIWHRLAALDNRIIYLLVAAVIIIPLIKPIQLPLLITDDVQAAYDLIGTFPEDSVVWLGCEVAATNAAELRPMMLAMARYALTLKHRIIIGGFWTDGCNLAQNWLQPLMEELGAVYGEDYVNLGYRASVTSILETARRSIIEAFSDRDIGGRKLSEMPVMKGVETPKDLDYLVILNPGSPGTATYIAAWRATGEVEVIIDCPTAGMLTSSGTNYQAGITKGMIAGMNGGAQLEQLVGFPDKAVRGMDAQGLTLFLVVGLLIVGNVSYFQIKRIEQQAKEV